MRIEGDDGTLDDLCRHWLFANRLVDRRSGSAILRMDETSLHLYGVYHLLSYGGRIRAAAPESLRGHLADIAEELLRRYRTPS